MGPRFDDLLPSSVDRPPLRRGRHPRRCWTFGVQYRHAIRVVDHSHPLRLHTVLCSAYEHEIRIRLDTLASPSCKRMGGAKVSTISVNSFFSPMHPLLSLPQIPGQSYRYGLDRGAHASSFLIVAIVSKLCPMLSCMMLYASAFRPYEINFLKS